MAGPQVADGVIASNMNGSCDNIEEAVPDSQQGVVLQLRGLVRCKKLLTEIRYPFRRHKLVPQTWIDPLVQNKRYMYFEQYANMFQDNVNQKHTFLLGSIYSNRNCNPTLPLETV
jgi:hypothetical protein